MRYLKHRKGQGLLETAITIVLMVLLLGGIINIWLWANKQIVLRQRKYNATRVIAGQAVDNYELRWAPTHPVYIPEELAEDKVLLKAPLLASEGENDNAEPSGTGSGEESPSATGPVGRTGGSQGFAPGLATDAMPEE